MNLLDKRLLNFGVIVFLSIITISWSFFIFKWDYNIYFLIVVIFLRCVSSFLLLRDYSTSWSKSSQKSFLRKIYVNSPTFVIVAFSFYGIVPFALIFSEFLFYLMAINFSVFSYYYISNRSEVPKTKLAVIYGAGAAGIKVSLEFENTEYRIKYFVDDNENLQKRTIGSIKVISKRKLHKELVKGKLDLLVIAIPRSSRSVVTSIFKEFQSGFVETKILPPLEDVLQDKSFMSQLKPVSLYDLLARPPKSLDKSIIKSFIKGQTVLVTGAGGSIGSEIIRQCIKYEAKAIILLDHSEFNLYKITEELSQKNVKFSSKLGSVVNKKFLNQVFNENHIDIVFHAAAYKHVPLVEDNINQAIMNNVIGTKNVIDTAIANNVSSFVLVSTDKAVRPTNVMGTTKRICELYAQNVDSKNTKISAVRFGNVLGSSGSVVPKFKEQIVNGGPITVTHPDITRYFMLIPEACELVLQSGAIANKSEVFVLNMGEPVKILDLAKQYLKLSNREDIDIKIIGLRPGEKLFEELLISDDDIRTQYSDIFIGKRTIYDIEELNSDIASLVCSDNQIGLLKKIVPEFDHKTN